MRRLTIQGPLDSFTSYGITLQKIFFALRRRGIHVSLRPTKVQTPFGTRIPAEMLASVVAGPQPEPWEVLFGPTIHLPTPDKKTFYWTTHEGEIPQSGLDLLDQSEVVMMMNKDMARSYSTHVTTALPPNLTRAQHMPRMVGYLPLGVDTNVFTQTPVPRHGFCNFGTAGRLAHGWHRKGVARVIKAFQEEFDSPDDAVRLMVKLHPDCAFDDPKDPRIVITRAHMSEPEIVAWLHGLRCYVSGASYEGFGLWPLQAMACGRPVIAMKDSGLDYADDNAVFVAEDDYKLRLNMRLIYADDYTREMLQTTANACAAKAQRWSLEKCVDRFVGELEACGALEPLSSVDRLKKAWGALTEIAAQAIPSWPNTASGRTPKIVHVRSVYPCSEADQERINLAHQSWNQCDDIIWHAVTNSALPREFVDDNRRLPYVKDLIASASAICGPTDIILLTNSDICFMADLPERLRAWLCDHPGAIFPRIQFRMLTKPISEHSFLGISNGTKQPGWDGFAFTQAWWEANKSRMPDMLMGAEAWDSVLAELIGREHELDGCMYHVEHVPMWKDGRFTLSSQKYNRALARRFFKTAGVPSPVDQEPAAEVPQNLV